MFYTIYKTTNTVNGKYYIGKHETENPNDDYLGSGKAIKQAIKRYGRSVFVKDVLSIFDNPKQMNDKERELITEALVSSKRTYTEGIGGEGGAHFKNKTHTPETRKLISDKLRGFKHTSDTRKKVSESNSRRRLSEETKKKLSAKTAERFAEGMPDEIRKKISDAWQRKRNIAE